MRLLISASFLSASMLLSGCVWDKPHDSGGHAMPPPPQIGVASPIVRSLAPTKTFTGSIEAIERVRINPQVSGVITKIYVVDGAEVKAGDKILEIDDAPYKAAVAQAEAELARAQSQLTIAQIQFERGKKLVEDHVISRQQYDDQAAAVQTADAEVQAAQAALDTARLNLGYCTLTAPIHGRIGKIQTTVGNLVQGGGPAQPTTITALVSVDPVYATFDVDEGTWQKIGQRLRAAAHGREPMTVRVGLLSDTDYPHTGTIVFVDNHIESGSGSIRVRAQIANSDQRLMPGAFARIELETDVKRDVILVHERAIQAQLNTRYVFSIDDMGAAKNRPVKLGASIGEFRIVEHGLTAHDQLAVVGLAKIFYDGMIIAPTPASMETLEFLAPIAQSEQSIETALSQEGQQP